MMILNWLREMEYRANVEALEEFERDSNGIESEYNKALRDRLQSAVDYSESNLK